MIKVGINGFGRIGRFVFRAAPCIIVILGLTKTIIVYSTTIQ